MIRLYELPPSPNSTKVRMALRLKGIPFDPIKVDPADRGNVVEATGQPSSMVRDPDSSMAHK